MVSIAVRAFTKGKEFPEDVIGYSAPKEWESSV